MVVLVGLLVVSWLLFTVHVGVKKPQLGAACAQGCFLRALGVVVGLVRWGALQGLRLSEPLVQYGVVYCLLLKLHSLPHAAICSSANWLVCGCGSSMVGVTGEQQG